MGLEGIDFLRYFAALLFVLGLIASAAWVGRKFGYLTGNPLSKKSRESRRLAIVETRGIDAKRRLVLIRRDGREHLLLLSATGDVVVESNIEQQQGTSAVEGVENQ